MDELTRLGTGWQTAQRHIAETTQGGSLAERFDTAIVPWFLRIAMRNKRARVLAKVPKSKRFTKQQYCWEVPLTSGSTYKQRLFIQSSGLWRYVRYTASGGEQLVLGRNVTGIYASPLSDSADELYDLLYASTVQFMRDHNMLQHAE